jgi:LPXTG-motif cell wall-anchored protein
MKNKMHLFTRLFILSSFLVITALLLTACSGAFSFQGSAQPNAQGGITVSGGAQPDAAAQPAPSTGMNSTTIILIVVAFVVLILILLMLVRRAPSKNQPLS